MLVALVLITLAAAAMEKKDAYIDCAVTGNTGKSGRDRLRDAIAIAKTLTQNKEDREWLATLDELDPAVQKELPADVRYYKAELAAVDKGVVRLNTIWFAASSWPDEEGVKKAARYSWGAAYEAVELEIMRLEAVTKEAYEAFKRSKPAGPHVKLQ